MEGIFTVIISESAGETRDLCYCRISRDAGSAERLRARARPTLPKRLFASDTCRSDYLNDDHALSSVPCQVNEALTEDEVVAEILTEIPNEVDDCVLDQCGDASIGRPPPVSLPQGELPSLPGEAQFPRRCA